jgi:predicted metalloprotease with PDZ domain
MATRRFVLSALLFSLSLVLLPSSSLAGTVQAAPVAGERISLTVSMDQPSTHYFHVVLRVDGIRSDTLDVKLPAWTPGYYQIMDYARNVLNFRAEDAAGLPLAWEKTTKNTWRLRTGRTTAVAVTYDVYAFAPSVADSYLDDGRAFICPAGVFMYVAGRLQLPVTVTVKPFGAWRTVSTGLDPVPGQADVFTAPDFDTLYDSPILVGNQEVIPFEVRGIPHVLAGNNIGSLDRAKLVADLQKMIEAAATLMGDIPYTHYAFLVIGPGGGGLEHLNSTALTMGGGSPDTREAYIRLLAFVTHEYFHLYNVKRIRPIALGPFDYDRENYTNMLWVSEGFTVYYEDVLLRRAGLLTRDEMLERAGANIARYENAPGHLFQSATESSFDTWIKFFTRTPNLATTTISYYDKGAALGLLLDLAIRHDSNNARSLDDVMRALYKEFYQQKKRGFTDAEFREVCERTAGAPLPEIFDVYASTVKPVDYAKYLAYAGIDVDMTPTQAPGAAWGAATEDRNGMAVVSRVEWDSPAARAGLSAQDEIVAVEGVRATSTSLAAALASRKPGDRMRILISRRGSVRELDVTLGPRTERSFRMKPVPDATPLQKAILASWLGER